jgi:hypothetical protein
MNDDKREQSGIAIVLLADLLRGPAHNVPFLWWCSPRSCRVDVGDAIPVTVDAGSGEEGSSRSAYDRRGDACPRQLVRSDL